MMSRVLRTLAFAGLCLPLAACGSDFFGNEEESLPGTRIAILSLDRGLEPDPAVADVEVRIPPPSVNTEWPQSGGSSTKALYHLALGTTLKRQWSADIGEGGSDTEPLLAQPLVAGGRVYTMDVRSEVSAFEAAAGKRIWSTDIDDDDESSGFFGGGIAYGDGRIYVTTGFGKAYALDAESGETLWSASVPGPVRGAPSFSDGRVFLVTIDNQTLVLGASDGRRLWSHVGVQEIASLTGAASPAVSGKTVVVPYSSGELIGLQAEDGRTLWSESLTSLRKFDPLQDIAQIRGDPVIDGNVVLAISHAGRMIAVQLEEGIRVWDIDVGGIQTPWTAGEFVFVLTNDTQLVSLRVRDGRIRWVRPLPRFEDEEDQDDPIRWFGPVLAGNRLIVAGSNGDALSVSPYDGEILDTLSLPGAAAVSPVVADGTLYFLTEGADLVAMR